MRSLIIELSVSIIFLNYYYYITLLYNNILIFVIEMHIFMPDDIIIPDGHDACSFKIYLCSS